MTTDCLYHTVYKVEAIDIDGIYHINIHFEEEFKDDTYKGIHLLEKVLNEKEDLSTILTIILNILNRENEIDKLIWVRNRLSTNPKYYREEIEELSNIINSLCKKRKF